MKQMSINLDIQGGLIRHMVRTLTIEVEPEEAKRHDVVFWYKAVPFVFRANISEHMQHEILQYCIVTAGYPI